MTWQMLSLLTTSDDIPYLRKSIGNLRFRDERKTITAIMDDIKNMLDYKVGHYVHYHDITYEQKQNVLRSFVFIKQKVFPNEQLDKLKARLVADGSQQGRHLYDFVSSAIVFVQVVYLLFNTASYYKCTCHKQ